MPWPLVTWQDRKRAKKSSAASKLETFSLLLADTVKVMEAGKTLEEKLVTKHDYKLAKVPTRPSLSLEHGVAHLGLLLCGVVQIMWEIGEDDKEEDEAMDVDGEDDEDKPRATVVGGRALRERKSEAENGLTQAEVDKKMAELVYRKMKERAHKAGSKKQKAEAEDEGKVEDLQAYRCALGTGQWAAPRGLAK